MTFAEERERTWHVFMLQAEERPTRSTPCNPAANL